MSKIKCLDNYHELREMFIRGERGNKNFFTRRLGIKPRTFYRLLNYLEKMDGMIIKYDKFSDTYCWES